MTCDWPDGCAGCDPEGYHDGQHAPSCRPPERLYCYRVTLPAPNRMFKTASEQETVLKTQIPAPIYAMATGLYSLGMAYPGAVAVQRLGAGEVVE